MPTTNAERCKKYRECNREEKRKRTAERVRAHRIRQKIIADNITSKNSTSASGPSSVRLNPDICEMTQASSRCCKGRVRKKNPLTSAERTRLWRAKKKKQSAEASLSQILPSSKDSVSSTSIVMTETECIQKQLAAQPVEEVVIKCEVIEISDDDSADPKPKKKRVRVRKPPNKNPVACEDCGKTFQTGYELKKHKRTHTGERPYMCTTCGKTYTQLGHLSIHALSHKGIKNFNCMECGSSFYRKADLDRHEKIHTGEKPYQCEICSKSFTQKNNLVMHFKMHIGDKPHECPVCLKRFLTRSKMLLHAKKHDKEKKKKGLVEEVINEDVM